MANPPTESESPTGRRLAAAPAESARVRPPRRSIERHGFGSAVGWTILGTLIPGLGLLKAGRRVWGTIVLTAAVGLLGFLGYLALGGRSRLTALAVDPKALMVTAWILGALGVLMVILIGATHLALRPASATVGQRIAGGALVSFLSVLVSTPLAVGSQYSYTTATVLSEVFGDTPSVDPSGGPQTIPADPWADKPRLNVLVLGGDTEKKRDPRLGLRADSVMVASIDTHTGAATLFSLPRQTARIPFPQGTLLHRMYPNGFYDGVNGSNAEYFLNAMYNNIPPRLPKGALGAGIKNVGAEVMKIGVGEALGLGKLDYYVAFSMDGFKEFINALGGITVNVNYRIPIGGKSSEGVPPDGWIEPGPNQHMNGRLALWYARGRYSLDDYSRIERQRCVINAVVGQARPEVVAARFNAIAAASKNNIITDVPLDLLPSLIDLGLKVKEHKLHSVVFKPGTIGWVSADPPWAAVRKRVQQALKEADAAVDNGSSPSPSASGSASPSASPKPTKSSTKTDDLTDACAYNPKPYTKP